MSGFALKADPISPSPEADIREGLAPNLAAAFLPTLQLGARLLLLLAGDTIASRSTHFQGLAVCRKGNVAECMLAHSVLRQRAVDGASRWALTKSP